MEVDVPFLSMPVLFLHVCVSGATGPERNRAGL